MACSLIRLNVGVIKKGFTVFDPSEGIANVGFPGANRFNFAALQLDTGFVALEDMVIAQRLAIEDRLGRHREPGPLPVL